jgi:hypothetical protein
VYPAEFTLIKAPAFKVAAEGGLGFVVAVLCAKKKDGANSISNFIYRSAFIVANISTNVRFF